MKKYKLVIFDFDYTLADASDGIYGSMEYAFKNLNLSVPSKNEVLQYVGLSLNDMFKKLTKIDDPILLNNFLKNFRKKANEIMTKNTVILKETKPTLINIKGNNILSAIVSTKYRFRILEALKINNLDSYFNLIIGGEDVNNLKPHPEGILKVIENLNINKENCLYVGDSTVDSEAAENAKVDFIGVLTGKTTSSQLNKFKNISIIKNLSELKNYIIY
ncbi:MAG: HAD-IA family hydrolase [Clostridiales bacterium]